jgi:NADPH-dependent ferric siderophore reductase
MSTVSSAKLHPVPPYEHRNLNVVAMDKSISGLVRVILGGPELDGFDPGLPASWVKVFVPGPTGNVGRAYTVRAFDRRRGLLEIDVVRRRRGGALSNWIYEHLQLGDSLNIAGPRGGVEVDRSADWHLLLGDETALPAIAAILPAIPQHARAKALVEVPYPGHAYREDAGIEFLFRGLQLSHMASFLESAVESLANPQGRGHIWIAGEAALVKRLRRQCMDRWGGAGAKVDATGYWKAGHEDYRDEEAYPIV